MNRRLGVETGAVAVLTAVLGVALFGIAALVVDLGITRDSGRQAQNTAAANALYAMRAQTWNQLGGFTSLC